MPSNPFTSSCRCRAASVLVLAAVSLGQPASALAQAVATPPPSTEPASVAPAADVAARVDAYMQAQARISRFSGVVMVARDGTPVISKGYGWANAEWEVPNTPQTKVRLGSITKQFPATLVLRLQEQKRLAVQDPICTYVAPCPDT